MSPLLVSLPLFMPALQAASAAPLNAAVLNYAVSNLGCQVGSGQCAVLANEAIKSTCAVPRGLDYPHRGDYVWGELIAVYQGQEGGPVVEIVRDRVRPGDIVQYRDAYFETVTKTMRRRMTASHHTSVVREAGEDAWTVLEQNVNGRLTVGETSLPIRDLKSGWLRIYRAVPDFTLKAKRTGESARPR